MKYLLTLILFILLSLSTMNGSGIQYKALLRDNNGFTIPNSHISVKASIIFGENLNEILYSETFSTTSDSYGNISLEIGTGITSFGIWEDIIWSQFPIFLKVEASHNGNNSLISISSINYVPQSIHALNTDNLVGESPDGSKWKLKVRTNGDLYWDKISVSDSSNSEYDKAKWPQELYFVGSFNNWNPQSSIKFTKIKEGKFALQHNIAKGDIFKFIKVMSWGGGIDWSGTSSKINDKAPLKEGGDTPVFEGESGLKMIIVDFSTFTLLIYPI